MKKQLSAVIITMIMCFCLFLTSSIPVLAETTLPKKLRMGFSSGAGGWYTEINIKKDGTFTGHYQDSDMGDTGKDYPNGTFYYCDFSGSFTNIKKNNNDTYTMTLNELKTDTPANKTTIKKGVRNISSEPYGLEKGKNFTLYCPGFLIKNLPQDNESKSWYQMYLSDTKTDGIKDYLLYNHKTKYSFYGD